MSALPSLVTNGRFVDLMIAFLVIEIIVIASVRKTKGAGTACVARCGI